MSISIPVSESAPPTTTKRRRWIKVDVESEVFDDLHLKAAQSRMRIQPYLRRCLSEARPYQVISDTGDFTSFSSRRSHIDENMRPVREPVT
jgi:hypothetical protein